MFLQRAALHAGSIKGELFVQAASELYLGHPLALRINVCIGHDQLHNQGNNGGQ